MSFSATIQLKGEKGGDIGKFHVLDFRFIAFSPRDTATGLASGRVPVPDLELKIVMEANAINTLQAMLYNDNIKDSELIFNKTDQRSTYQKVSIAKAHCFHFEQLFNSYEKDSFVVLLKFKTQDITFDCDGVSSTYQNLYATGQN